MKFHIEFEANNEMTEKLTSVFNFVYKTIFYLFQLKKKCSRVRPVAVVVDHRQRVSSSEFA